MLLGCRCALFVALICAVSGVEVLHVKVGGEVSFKPNPTLSSDNTITWKFKAKDGGVIRVIEFDHGVSSSPQNPLFKDNAAADNNTGELTLYKLAKNHIGLYYFEINSKEQEQKFQLKVMEEVPQPELNRVDTSNPEKAIYLECQYNATIIWNCTNKDTPAPVPANGQKIGESIIFEKTKNIDTCCTCTLINDVSEKTSKPICERDAFPGSNAGVVVGVVIGVIFILLCVFIALYVFSVPFRGAVHNKCGETLCLGAMLNGLEKCRNAKPKPGDKQDDVTTGYEAVKETEDNAEEESKGPQQNNTGHEAVKTTEDNAEEESKGPQQNNTGYEAVKETEDNAEEESKGPQQNNTGYEAVKETEDNAEEESKGPQQDNTGMPLKHKENPQ